MASNSNNHEGIKEEFKNLFPLKSIPDVIRFFQCQIENDSEPDLTLLSIITGYIENTLTSSNITETPAGNNASAAADTLNKFPVVTFETVDELYKKFHTILSVMEKSKSSRPNRHTIKRVSDIIWYSLIRSSYKDRAHVQSLYSYLAWNKLDCFGVALAVVAGCQLLGYKGVHLAISEDHAWIVYGRNQTETIEVTWHGKGLEDKRGQDISSGYESRSWLYLAGEPVICDRFMEVAAIVSAINPSLTITSDCLEVANLQQQLLWLLYDKGHLQNYPMCLGNLGELEEVSPTIGRPKCVELYDEAVKSAFENYKNHHVYPYTYQGGYYYRQCNYREALASWANAGDVIRLYNHSRDDEEIYKEFLDIANEMIPHVMKTESSGHSAKSILRDPSCFANLLKFYDGICQWEEGSLTPILHIGWAKPLVNTISKFDYDIRSQVIINCGENEDKLETKINGSHNSKKQPKEQIKNCSKNADILTIDEGNNNNCIKKDDLISGTNETLNIPTLAALTAACGEKILNPDFLLQGGGEPFADNKEKKSEDTLENIKPINKLEIQNSNKSEIQIISNDKTTNITIENKYQEIVSNALDYDEYKPKQPIITLYSHKMKGIKDLLLAEKLNTHAISLQVTAQSQVAAKKGRGEKQSSQSTITETDNNTRPKRYRRD